MPEQPARVLLLDGTSLLAEAVAKAFDGTDYELRVQPTSAGPTNLKEVIGSFAPDLVLVDVNVRDGGFTLCGELRAMDATRQLPVMLLTSETADETMVSRGLLCGADDFVRVSERPAEFQARVRIQLRNKRDRDRLRRLRVERDHLRMEAVDSLTSLPNRRAIEAHVEEAWSKAAPFALVLVDVDNLKLVNDGFGHDAGDQVLRDVAQALAITLRPQDRCGRWGGDEFGIVLGSVGQPSEAMALAEQFRAAVEALKPAHGSPVSASFGVAMLDPSAPDPSHEVLCQRADAALYDARRSGKNRVVLARAIVARAGHVSLKMERVSAPPRAADREQVEAALLKELGAGRAGLPLLPESASEALRLAEDPRTDIVRIARLVNRDPPLAARFVAVAGSALYSRGVKPTSTQAAFVRIGLAAARDLLLQAVHERTTQDLPSFRSEVARSFDRSVRTGIAARLLASELRMGYESAYLCGLLHDIGESRVYRILAQMPLALDLPEFAHELVVRHHQRAGAEVARAWHLPPEVIDACGHHHSNHATAPVAVKIVMGADALISMFDEPEGPHAADLAVMVGLGLSERQVTDLLERVRASISVAAGSGPSPEGVDRDPRVSREGAHVFGGTAVTSASRRPTAMSLRPHRR